MGLCEENITTPRLRMQETRSLLPAGPFHEPKLTRRQVAREIAERPAPLVEKSRTPIVGVRRLTKKPRSSLAWREAGHHCRVVPADH